MTSADVAAHGHNTQALAHDISHINTPNVADLHGHTALFYITSVALNGLGRILTAHIPRNYLNL